MIEPSRVSDHSVSRRLFLKRASQLLGAVALLPIIGSSSVAASTGDERYYERSIPLMGTTARIGVYFSNEREAHSLIASCFAELQRLDSLFSTIDPGSELSQINLTAGGLPLNVSEDIYSLLTSAIAYSRQTRRAFDPTIEPLMRLWGFRTDSKELAQIPSTHDINAALQYAGPDEVEFHPDSQQIRLRSHGAKLDLGGIAKGYALDKIAASIRKAGIQRALLQISGDMVAVGAPPGKDGWEIAIPNPQNPAKYVHKMTIKDQALATSGNYRSYVIYNAVKFGHILDPHDGEPAHRVLSATVVATTAIEADALSTASFVSGTRYGATKLLLVSPQGTIQEA